METADRFVVLTEHVMDTSLVQLDATGIRMIALECELLAQGIDALFDPFRPGEGGGFTRDFAQPIRLLVKQGDLERARSIAAALAAEGGSSEE